MSSKPPQNRQPVADLRNLGPKSVSLNLLWALAAGLEARDRRALSKAEKEAPVAEARVLRR